jgi:adenosylhomocysteinase
MAAGAPTEPGALADAGRASIAWAQAQMPVLRSIRERFAAERPLDGLTVGACLHVTAETAVLVRALAAGGARVALCAANPLATRDDVAVALDADDDVVVHGRAGDDADGVARGIAAVARAEPAITLDDGADLLTFLHLREGGVGGLLGGVEETTTGLLRARAMEREGLLTCPVLAVNEAETERVFNDRFGTGQSTLDGILRATNVLLAGRTVVVLGYGITGRGIAERARGAGAAVIVCEVDPMAALRALMDGFWVLPSLDAAARGDVFITVTGSPAVLGAAHFAHMRDGAILANAGHFDVEIDLAALRGVAAARTQVLPLVEQYDLGDGRRLNLLAQGRVVNLAAGEGHPAEIMDISFALQALAVEHLARHGTALGAGVHPVPAEIDAEVARLKLAALGVGIDTLSAEQARYRGSWR